MPQFLARGTRDRLIRDAEGKEFVDALVARPARGYIQVGGAGHAFFDWKPDATPKRRSRSTGVYYAGAMKAFFESVLH